MRSAVVFLALRLCAAGAQSPEQLLDLYTATGADSALAAARKALADSPESHRAGVLRARVLLAEGDAEKSLLAARRCNRNMPDDLETYAVIVDAALILGRVGEAERAAQWMLDLRPEDVRSLVRGAAVREALKDYEGAAQMLSDAFARTSRGDVALRAGIGVSLARVNLQLGRTPSAAKLLNQVQSLIPGYRPAELLRTQMEKEE